MRRKNFKNIVTEAIKDCFTAGTKIQTVEGEKNIEDIQVGDKVLAKDEKTGKQEYKEVVHLFQKQVDTIYQVHVGKEVIETTAEHPFWVKGKGWVHAKDLQPGDQLETDQGQHVKVTQIVKQEKQTTVYNFEVKNYHTYYVSGLHLLVHNMCGPLKNEAGEILYRAGKVKYRDRDFFVKNGIVQPGREGMSIDTDADKLTRHFSGGVHELYNVSDKLKATWTHGTHYTLGPKSPMPVDELKELLGQITTKKVMNSKKR